MSQTMEILENWSQHHTEDGFDPKPTISLLCDMVEREMEQYVRQDPDPFDDRHPSRTDPECAFGQILRSVFKNETFVNKVSSNYLLHRDDKELNMLSARFLYGCIPGIDPSTMFGDSDDIVNQLHRWILDADEPLRSYATGLMAEAMDVNDIASNYRDMNAQLVPVMLVRLRQLQAHVKKDTTGTPLLKYRTAQSQEARNENDTPVHSQACAAVSLMNGETSSGVNSSTADPANESRSKIAVDSPSANAKSIRVALKRRPEDSLEMNGFKRSKLDQSTSRSSVSPVENENSCSSWAEVEPKMIGSVAIFPITAAIQQRLILQYLQPVGEYQDFLSSMFENDAMKLIFFYIDFNKNKDVRLAYEALRVIFERPLTKCYSQFLCSLLVHRKFSLEFVAHSGIEFLMNVYRPSVASAAVSVCLFYMAYNTDVMEKICVLPLEQLHQVVDYALWLLEHSYESGRCHATMFFSYAFAFRHILELFDAKDGLRKLFNCISTLTILQGASQGENDLLSDDQLYQSRQAVRNVCSALRRYMTSHMWLKVDKIKSSQSKLEMVPGVPVPSAICTVPPYKAMIMDETNFRDSIWLLMNQLPMTYVWKPVEDMIKLDMISMLAYILGDASDWGYGAKNEILKNVTDVLWVCTVIPGVQVQLVNSMKLSQGQETTAIGILLALASGVYIQSADLQMGGLNILINLVCGPWNRFGTVSVTKPSTTAPINGASFRSTENRSGVPKIQVNARDLLDMMWESVRDNNGIMTFTKLLLVKSPLSDADAIRALACRALDGLARSDKVKQIVGKMPLIARNELHWLIREPIAQEKRQEHMLFRQHARSLIENVTGKPLVDAKDLTQDKIWRANVVANTQITYNEKELLQLIHQHLKRKGYRKSAAMLKDEADLPNIPASQVKQPIKIRKLPSVLPQPGFSNLPSTSTAHTKCSMFLSGGTQSMVGGISAFLNRTPGTPMPFKKPTSIYASASKATRKSSTSVCTPGSSPLTPRQLRPPETAEKRAKKTQMSLNTMVTEYFRKQHAMCQNPVANCPPFSVFYPHHCPEPKLQRSAPHNIVQRYYNRPINPVGGGYDGVRMDVRYAFSRFKPYKVYKDPEGQETFKCCRFSADDQNLLLGTFAGDLKVYNVANGQELMTHQVHSSEVTVIDPSKDGKFLLTSSAFVRPYSGLWAIHEQVLENRFEFSEESFVEFCKWDQNRVLSTKGNIASIWDMNSSQVVTVLNEDARDNPYQPNKATYHPFDNSVLSDGLLWDVRSSSVVHKFDKLNDSPGGVFHPRGMEVIINTEVWDVRTYRLLHTCPALDNCKIIFNATGDIIYGVVHSPVESVDFEEAAQKSFFGRSFRTVDTTDYSVIATTDVKRNIYDLCTDSHDNYLALIELAKDSPADDILSMDDCTVCRAYVVGGARYVDETADDENANDEEDEDEDELDDDDDNDDIDDIDDDDDDEPMAMVEDDSDSGSASMSESDEDLEDEDVEDAVVNFLEAELNTDDSDSSGSEDDPADITFEPET